jgi:hypothetical protein
MSLRVNVGIQTSVCVFQVCCSILSMPPSFITLTAGEVQKLAQQKSEILLTFVTKAYYFLLDFKHPRKIKLDVLAGN